MRTDLDAQAMQQTEREAFEALIIESYNITPTPGETPFHLRRSPSRPDTYLAQDVHYQWVGWEARAALQSRLAAPVGDAVAWMDCFGNVNKVKYRGFSTPLYTHPAPDAVRRETVEACAAVCEALNRDLRNHDVVRMTAAKLAAAIRAMLKGE